MGRVDIKGEICHERKKEQQQQQKPGSSLMIQIWDIVQKSAVYLTFSAQ